MKSILEMIKCGTAARSSIIPEVTNQGTKLYFGDGAFTCFASWDCADSLVCTYRNCASATVIIYALSGRYGPCKSLESISGPSISDHGFQSGAFQLSSDVGRAHHQYIQFCFLQFHCPDTLVSSWTQCSKLRKNSRCGSSKRQDTRSWIIKGPTISTQRPTHLNPSPHKPTLSHKMIGYQESIGNT